MTAEVIEGREIQSGLTGTWIVVGGATCVSLEEAREIAAALHRYDLAKMHDQLEETP